MSKVLDLLVQQHMEEFSLTRFLELGIGTSAVIQMVLMLKPSSCAMASERSPMTIFCAHT